jgi:EmrB/QacA subfamily drug resistance transporter
MNGTRSPASTRTAGIALMVLCAATLMIILDGTIVTVALPAIQRDLSMRPQDLTWVLNAYLIAFGGLLLLAGRLGDLLGRRRMLLAGLAAFTAASLACGLARTAPVLITARFIQGAGGAMIAAVSLGMIVRLYAEPPRRARAIGAYSFVGAAGASIGLILGGVITQALSWHWIFFVNLPIGAAAALGAALVLPADRGIGLRAGADWPGALLVTGGLMTAIYAIVQTSGAGWMSPRTAVLGVLAVALLAAFSLRQARAAAPLLPPRVLAAAGVAAANVAQVLVIAAALGFQVLITLYLQRVLGYGPAAAGLGLFPTAGVIGAVSLGLSARLSARFGQRAVLLTGLVLVAVALAALVRLPVHAHYAADLLPEMLVFGAGGGLTLPALAGLGMSGARQDDAGLVSGLFNTTQQVGGALGIAVLSAVAAARTARLHDAGTAVSAALTGGYRLAFAVAAGLAVAALLVASVLLRSRLAQPDQPRCLAADSGEGTITDGQSSRRTAGSRRLEVRVGTC